MPRLAIFTRFPIVPDYVYALSMTVMPRLAIFTRFPTPGAAKARLVPALGAADAAALQRRLTENTLAEMKKTKLPVEVWTTGGSTDAFREWLGPHHYVDQGSGDLGARMLRAMTPGPALVVGSDIPDLRAAHVMAAARKLADHDVVLGPAEDGGYWLIGTNKPQPELFDNVVWGGADVLSKTLSNAKGLKVGLAERLADLDTPADLARWPHIVPLKIGVVIPALNEAALIEDAIARLAGVQVVVADGGSKDETRKIAKRAGAIVVTSTEGRGMQQNVGAEALGGVDVILFLHADTVLPNDWQNDVRVLLARPAVSLGAFRLGIDHGQRHARIVEWGSNLRSRWLGLPYGDQALFLRRETFNKLGGYRALPIMEDFDIVRRSRRLGRIALAKSRVTTSARRWTQRGFFWTTLVNQMMVIGWMLKLPPEKLAGFYRKTR